MRGFKDQLTHERHELAWGIWHTGHLANSNFKTKWTFQDLLGKAPDKPKYRSTDALLAAFRVMQKAGANITIERVG